MNQSKRSLERSLIRSLHGWQVKRSRRKCGLKKISGYTTATSVPFSLHVRNAAEAALFASKTDASWIQCELERYDGASIIEGDPVLIGWRHERGDVFEVFQLQPGVAPIIYSAQYVNGRWNVLTHIALPG